MAPRAHWKGFLKLSLVSCPIALYPATSAAEKVSFRQVNRETGNRLRQQLVDAVTGELVASHSKGRGYEVGENDFLLVENEELQSAQQEARERPFSAAPASAPSSQATREAQLNSPPMREAPPKSRAPLRLAQPDPEEAPAIVPPAVPPR